MTLTVGSLFSGIGGLDLGLERAGIQVLWQCEIDDYCRRVLTRHWPEVPKYGDIRTLDTASLPVPDLLCGGFPCTDISYAGKGAGIDGEHSGLWSELYRIICDLRPHYVLVENVPALLERGLGRVLGSLAAVGYDAEWSVLSACAMGAPHPRERLFIVAHSNSDGLEGRTCLVGAQRTTAERTRGSNGSYWDDVPEPRISGVASRPAGWVGQLRGLGNAVVPQVAEYIGRQIVAHADAIRAEEETPWQSRGR